MEPVISLNMQYKTIIIKKHKGGCSEIILNQPEKHNTLSPLMIEELNDIFDEIGDDKNTKIVIISAIGKSFCAGGDLKWLLPADVNPLYLEHLKGESKVEIRTGVWEWREVSSNAANHGLDTSAMLVCMSLIAGVLRWTPPKQ